MPEPTRENLARALVDLLEKPDDFNTRLAAKEVLNAYHSKSESGSILFATKAAGVGADPTWYWQTIQFEIDINGKTSRVTYRVVDIEMGRPKNCMVIQSKSGRRKFVSVAWVVEHLGEVNAPRVRTRALEI